MTEALERLIVIGLFSAVAIWILNDIRRHLRDGEIRMWRQWGVPSGIAIRGRDPFTFWSAIICKAVGAAAAITLAIAYFYYSATN